MGRRKLRRPAVPTSSHARILIERWNGTTWVRTRRVAGGGEEGGTPPGYSTAQPSACGRWLSHGTIAGTEAWNRENGSSETSTRRKGVDRRDHRHNAKGARWGAVASLLALTGRCACS